MLKGAIEPIPVEDTILHGVHLIEPVPGDLIRYWLYVIEGGERIIKAKNVFPRSAIAEMQHVHQQTFSSFAGASCRIPRVVIDGQW